MKRANVSFFDRLFGKTRDAALEARHAELEGDLPRAARLWAEANRADEAARVTLLRGDGELQSSERLRLYVQAVALAPEGHAIRTIARRKRALLSLAIAREGATSAAARLDLLDAGRELEALGESAQAAEAYELAGDVDGQTRALVGGGDIDRLEDVLDRDRERTRGERARQGGRAELERLLTCGERREALALAEAIAAASPGDRAAAERIADIRARRVTGPRVSVQLRETKLVLILGNEVLLGRGEGAIVATSHAVSRRHLNFERVDGSVWVRDLGSRNGTTLRGIPIAGRLPVPMPRGLELLLGGEVSVLVSASDIVAGAIEIAVAGARYVAPLGPAHLGIGPWRLETASDAWVELVTDDAPPAHMGGLRLPARVPLLDGDAIAASRDEPSVLRIG